MCTDIVTAEADTVSRPKEMLAAPHPSAKAIQNSPAQVEPQHRPYPWDYFSDSTYFAMGVFILFFVIIPSMSIIALSNIVGYALKYAVYDHNPTAKRAWERLCHLQAGVFQRVADWILLDPRDGSYLPWIICGNLIQPAAFYWAYQRYSQHDTYMYQHVLTFLLYHLMRVGPCHQMFAHHATLVHKEGHAHRRGLYRNLWWPVTTSNKNKSSTETPLKSQRISYPKLVRRLLLDHVIAGVAGIFYGTIPNHYATAHNKIHHRWHNDLGDVHTNMDFDRTEFKSYVMFLPRFTAYWTGLSPLLLFWKRGEYQFFFNLACGVVYYYSIGFFAWYKMGFFFYWAYFLYPLLEGASFLGMIAYLWHMFSDESDPSNQYVNSITILRGSNNVWNEDFHVVHHHEPGVHWSEMPQSFYSNIDKYAECRATVFADCEQGLLINWIFGKQWDALADHFVDLQYVFSNGELNEKKFMTVKQIRQVEQNIQRTDLLHADVKEMLLRRLRFRYLGSRKDTGRRWAQFQDQANLNVRDFEKKEA